MVYGMAQRPRNYRPPLRHDPQALRYALDKSGLTQVELARKVGISEGHISELLSGTRSVRAARLIAIAEALNCPLVVLEAKRPTEAAS